MSHNKIRGKYIVRTPCSRVAKTLPTELVMFALAAGAAMAYIKAGVHWPTFEGFLEIDPLCFQKD